MVRTRIAPSPTGQDIHLGTVATALMNYAWAKKNNGQFIIRIEDTDRSRLVEGAEKKMLSTIDELGLTPDESPKLKGLYGPYRQSERLEIYQKYAAELVKKGYAYYCYCSKERLDKLRQQQQANKVIPKYDKHCLNHGALSMEHGTQENYVIRLNVPENKEISFDDIIRGKITFNTNNIDDQVLIKSDGYPTYHLAVVIDDYLMKISHVIRGEEWLSSTPKHILLYQYLGWQLPQYAHISLLRNPDKSKLSKRKNPVWVSDYLKKGILIEALLNYLSLMGWGHPEQKEIFSLDEYIKVFDLKDIQTTAPVFDQVKLEWMSGEYIRKLSNNDLRIKINEFYKGKYSEELIEKTIPLIKERIKTLAEYDDYCRFFIERPTKYDIDLSTYAQMFKHLSKTISTIPQDQWKADKLGEVMQSVAKELNIANSKFFMAVRVAISGRKITPPLNESMDILGKEECLRRLKIVRNSGSY